MDYEQLKNRDDGLRQLIDALLTGDPVDMPRRWYEDYETNETAYREGMQYMLWWTCRELHKLGYTLAPIPDAAAPTADSGR